MSAKTVFLAGAMINTTDKLEDHYKYEWRKNAYDYFNENIDGFDISFPPEFYDQKKSRSCNGKETLRFDMHNVRESDIVLVNLKDLERSLSTSDEILYAYISQKPVIGFLEDGDMNDIHPWKLEQMNKVFEGKDSMKRAIHYIATYYGG